MGILKQDLSKKILDIDLPYFQRMTRLITMHQGKIEQCYLELNEIDDTRYSLDYLKRQAMKSPENDVAVHILLLTEIDIQRQFAQAELIRHSACAKLFQDALTQFIIIKYRVHEKQIEEWHIDLEGRLLYRKVKTSEEHGDLTLEEVQEITDVPMILDEEA